MLSMKLSDDRLADMCVFADISALTPTCELTLTPTLRNISVLREGDISMRIYPPLSIHDMISSTTILYTCIYTQ